MEIDPQYLLTQKERWSFNDRAHYLGKPCKRGHIDVDGLTWRARNGHACVLCKREIALEWKRRNPDRHRAATAKRDATRDHSKRKAQAPFGEHAGNIRNRCRSKGLVATVYADDLKLLWRAQGGLCFWTGRPLDFAAGGPRSMFRPSIDRLNPSEGYVSGNIVWASNFANRARGDTPAAEFALAMREFGFRGPFEERF